jgi:hypothetical protein
VNIHMSKRLFLAAAVFGAVALIAAAFFVAPTLRSVVAGPSASPDAPNPGHAWSEIGLPGGTWPGLDADMLDGMHAGQTGTNYIPYADGAGNVGIGTTEPSEKLDVDGNATISGNVGIDGSLDLAPDAPIRFETGTDNLSRMYATSLGYAAHIVNGWNVAGSPNAIPLTQLEPSHQTAWSSLYEYSYEGAPLYVGWGVGFTDAGADVRRTPFATYIQGDAIYIQDGGQISLGKIWRDASSSYWQIRQQDGLGEPTHFATLSVDNNGILTISPESYTSFSGNVGVGTAEPEGKLHIKDGDLVVGEGGGTTDGIVLNGVKRTEWPTDEAGDVHIGTVGTPNLITLSKESLVTLDASTYYGGGHCSSITAYLYVDGDQKRDAGQSGCYHNSDTLSISYTTTLPAGEHSFEYTRSVGDASAYSDYFVIVVQ